MKTKSFTFEEDGINPGMLSECVFYYLLDSLSLLKKKKGGSFDLVVFV